MVGQAHAAYTDFIKSNNRSLTYPCTVMRPLFAIAPLALLLVLIGPVPKEANQALAAIKAKILPADKPTSRAEERSLSVAKPALSAPVGLSPVQSAAGFHAKRH